MLEVQVNDKEVGIINSIKQNEILVYCVLS
jgi:hypothetical protein